MKSVLILVLVIGLFCFRIYHSPTSNIVFELTADQVTQLKQEVELKRDGNAAWRLAAYYEVAKSNDAESQKWMTIARQIEGGTTNATEVPAKP